MLRAVRRPVGLDLLDLGWSPPTRCYPIRDGPLDGDAAPGPAEAHLARPVSERQIVGALQVPTNDISPTPAQSTLMGTAAAYCWRASDSRSRWFFGSDDGDDLMARDPKLTVLFDDHVVIECPQRLGGVLVDALGSNDLVPSERLDDRGRPHLRELQVVVSVDVGNKRIAAVSALGGGAGRERAVGCDGRAREADPTQLGDDSVMEGHGVKVAGDDSCGVGTVGGLDVATRRGHPRDQNCTRENSQFRITGPEPVGSLISTLQVFDPR